MTRFRSVVHVVLLATLSACSGSSGDLDENGRPSPEQALTSAEERLMESSATRVDFIVTATGAVDGNLTGSLLLGDSGQARWTIEGTLRGEEVDLLLVSDGTRMRLGNGVDTVEAATPPRLKEALILGLTRMGVTHNVLRLAELLPPDHADGRVDSWVQAADVRREERGNLAFNVEADGAPGEAVVLYMAPGTELPGERQQTHQFPDGEASVTEIYSAVSIGAGVDPSDFTVE